jgi:integrase
MLSTTTAAIEQFEESEPYFNFINSLKAQATKEVYKVNLFMFLRYYRLTSASSLMTLSSTELRDKIVRYFLENKHLSKASQQNRLSTLKHFCEMNDIILNWKRISKFVHSDVPKSTDRGYTQDEIKQIIDFSDHRVTAVFLFLASTGVRAGSLRMVKLKHLEDKGQVYKVKVYPGEPEEYFTFTTPECKDSLDRYFAFRKRNGEAIVPDSFVFVQQYNRIQRIRARAYAKGSLENLLQDWLINCGIRQVDPLAAKFKRKEVPRLHGFRKFFTTQLVNARINPEIREMLLGHKIGLASAYYKPSEEDILQEYSKGIDSLTIDPANRLRKKVEKLEVEKNQFDAAEIEALKRKIK